MERVFFLILLIWALGSAGLPGAVMAQEFDRTPAVRTAGTVVNLFETLDPSSPIDGARLELPQDWTVRDVHLLRYGTKSVSLQHRTQTDGSILLTTDRSIEGPHELVLQVQMRGAPGTYRWELTPFTRAGDGEGRDSTEQRAFRTAQSRTRRVRINSPSDPDGPNRALDLSRARQPLLLRPSSPLSLGRSAFTIEFWVRTTGLDEVLFSTWTGEETASYPAEFVIDQSGRLRFYFGRAGKHQALRTTSPVADNHWHHAAVVYDQSAARLRLVVDGTVADSMQTQALPSRSSPRPIAIGGRLPRSLETDSRQRLYSGRLDEIRIWPSAHSTASIRRKRSQPFAPGDAEEDPLRLSFNEDPDVRVDWPEGGRRVASALSFRSSLPSLEAHSSGQSVTLRWQADLTDEGTFVVERSVDGYTFNDIARLDPSDVLVSSSQSREVVYTDENVPDQVVYYRIRQVKPNREVERTTGTVKIGLGGDINDPQVVELVGNFPNPFRETTTIAYRIEEAHSVTLSVWDLSGKRVATLAEGMHEPGYYEETLTARDLPSGTYFARLNSAQGVQSHRMVLLK